MVILQNTSQVKETRETERLALLFTLIIMLTILSFPSLVLKAGCYVRLSLSFSLSLPLYFNSNPSMTSNEDKVQGALDNHNQDVVLQNAKYVVLHPETQLHSKDAANKFNHQTRTLITGIFLPREGILLLLEKSVVSDCLAKLL